ncbi:hypothetical protein DdX_02913 [Ditylenchus destructor]|uniref:Uncharacterized protein n=1 Tax=Ditylenchus destructor TaxID=166010 RepID=A0AAD4R6G1_9BILA|nr:hypothetical protein DdX_02913 [Ditylenchus destructor]
METPCDENLSYMEKFDNSNLADNIFEYDLPESPVGNRCYKDQTEVYASIADDALSQQSTIVAKDILLDTFRFLPRKNLDILQPVCRLEVNWNILNSPPNIIMLLVKWKGRGKAAPVEFSCVWY